MIDQANSYVTHLNLSGATQLGGASALAPLRSAVYAGDLLVTNHLHALRHVQRSSLGCILCASNTSGAAVEAKRSSAGVSVSASGAPSHLYRCVQHQDDPSCRDFVLCHSCVRQHRQDSQLLGSGLRELDLRSTGLETVPLWFGNKRDHFPFLEKLFLSGNPKLVTPSTELGRRAGRDVRSTLFGGVQDGGVEALRYLQIIHQPLVDRQQAQLVTVGHAEVGKSTLLKNAYLQPLVQNEPRELQKLGRTKMALFLRMRRELELRGERHSLWFLFRDLPGQPQFWSSNVHFLSADCAVFLVVLSLEVPKTERQAQLDLWLSSLDALAAEERPGRVLIVCTHADKRKPEESLESIEDWLKRETESSALERKGYHFLGKHVRVKWMPPVVAHVETSGGWFRRSGFMASWNTCARDMARVRRQVDELMIEMLFPAQEEDSTPDNGMQVPGFVQPLRQELAKWRRDNPRRWCMNKEQAQQLVNMCMCFCFFVVVRSCYLLVHKLPRP